MEFVEKTQRIPHQNNTSCTAYEYEMKEEAINGAVIELLGRYPESGQAMNSECVELIYVISGKGYAAVEDEQMELVSGDQLLISPNEKYYLEGMLEVYIACTPAWSPQQHGEVG